MSRVLQSRAFGGLLCAIWGIIVSVCVIAAMIDPRTELRHPAVTGSAAATVVWMLFAWVGMLIGSRVARLAWTLGLLTLFIHLILAFGVAHGWSHAAAVEHVRQVGGYGEGIVVNYLFVAVWCVDVLWWQWNPTSHVNRSRWIGVIIHGFMLFVVVNATVVFGPPERRFAYAIALGIVAVFAIAKPRTTGFADNTHRGV